MTIIRTIGAMQTQARAWLRQGLRVGFVPTMGYLHEGHLSLIDVARARAERVVLSIFVNPTQFGPKEDLAKYPRAFARDCALCEARGCDVIFAPEVAEMYAPDHSTWVVEEQLSQPLCGRSRPGHFRGVTTVVAKLFLAVLPDVAVFGQKDAQQALVIQRMARDLNFPLDIIVAPTVREADGLAKSSRNTYLSAAERQAGLALSRGLGLAAAAHAAGERDPRRLEALVRRELEASGARLDYVECVDGHTLGPLTHVNGPALIAVAAFYGNTRLIDNCRLG